MQKKEKCFIIQGFYSYGWEDLSCYPMGNRQANRAQARHEARVDLEAYRQNERGCFRIIERYETK